MITTEALTAAGWKKMGGAWYGPNNRKLTNFDDQWQVWRNGLSITVTLMSEL